MTIIKGRAIQKGLAVGRLRLYRGQTPVAAHTSALSPDQEQQRFDQAARLATEQLEQLYQSALPHLGQELADIFRLQQELLRDPDLLDTLHRYIQGGASAQYAVFATGEDCAAMLLATGDELLAARAADVRDLAQRLQGILNEEKPDALTQPVILMASQLTPSQTAQLDRSLLLGLVSTQDSPTGHTAILARAMGIPFLTGIDIDSAWDGHTALLDGDREQLVLQPEEDALKDAALRQDLANQLRQDLLSRPLSPILTPGSKPVRLCANVGTLQDAQLSMQYGAEGIGLLRTEFLFLERETCPPEEEQFQYYRGIIQTMAGSPVVIRTMDMGADKQCPCLRQEQEPNPALGLRGIRYSLAHPELLRTQLRAILRAAAFGCVAVMFPMVTSVYELRQAKDILAQCRRELKAEGVPIGALEVGTMIETPAAAILADDLAGEVDFFSIGTNDLTQYLLAADRQNPHVETLLQPDHPALMALLRHVIETAHRHHIWAGVCGEMASEPRFARQLLELDADELSVSPAALLSLREALTACAV